MQCHCFKFVWICFQLADALQPIACLSFSVLEELSLGAESSEYYVCFSTQARCMGVLVSLGRNLLRSL